MVTGVEMKPQYLVCDAGPAIHNGFRMGFGFGNVDDDTSGNNNEDADDDTASETDVTEQQEVLQYLIIMCYFHVILSIQSKYKFAKAHNKAPFKDDVRLLHLCDNKEKFTAGCALFVKKWKRVELEPTRLLKKSFFDKNKNWYIGCAPRVPKTNNPMEVFNSTMERCQTEHRRQPLKQFLHTALAIQRVLEGQGSISVRTRYSR